MTENDDKGQHERNLDTVRRWYHNHSEEYNEARRQRYADDDDIREKAKERARSYRARRRNGTELISEPMYRFVNKNGPCAYGEGLKIHVYTTGHIAQVIGSTPQMLRNWELKGWIPDSIFPDKHRLYTDEQVGLIIGLSEYMVFYRKSPKAYKAGLLTLVTNIKEQWNKIYANHL